MSGTDPAEIGVPLTNAEMMSLWMINEDWHRACSNYLGEINKNIQKANMHSLLKKTNCILVCIIKRTLITEVPTCYTNTNMMQMEISRKTVSYTHLTLPTTTRV